MQVARAFGALYLAAVKSGNVGWASSAELQSLLHADVRLSAHDGQRFAGRDAVVRRLNQGN